MLCHTAPSGGKRRIMTNGSAVIHINGAQYQLAGQYTDPSSAGFQNLTQRIERMLGSNSVQLEYFDVKIDGHKGALIVRPSQLVSAAVVFVPETEVSVY
jgi:hypothetical protein